MSDLAEVVVVGDVLVDVVTVPAGPLAPGSETPATIRAVGGGAAANTACWLAALGRPVRLASAVGDDALGSGAVAELTAAGVTWVGATVAGAATGTCVVLVDPRNGERTMLPDRGANDLLDERTAVAAVDQGAAWVHVSGYALLGEGSRAAGRAAIERAVAAGIPVSVDAASAAPIARAGAATFLSWVTGARLVFANDDEVRALGGAEAVLSASRELIAKHGAGGSSWTDGTVKAHTAARPVAVVDTVGAGDALDAGFIEAVLQGATPQQALDAAADVAARAVARAGARP